MRERIAALILALICISATTQTPQQTYVLKDGIAEWNAPAGKDIEFVWAAIQKIIMGMRWSTEIAEKEALKIVAKQAYTNMATLDKSDDEMPRAEILLTKTGEVVTVMARWYIPGGGLKFGWGSARKKFYKKFFTSLDEAAKSP